MSASTESKISKQRAGARTAFSYETLNTSYEQLVDNENSLIALLSKFENIIYSHPWDSKAYRALLEPGADKKLTIQAEGLYHFATQLKQDIDKAKKAAAGNPEETKDLIGLEQKVKIAFPEDNLKNKPLVADLHSMVRHLRPIIHATTHSIEQKRALFDLAEKSNPNNPHLYDSPDIKPLEKEKKKEINEFHTQKKLIADVLTRSNDPVAERATRFNNAFEKYPHRRDFFAPALGLDQKATTQQLLIECKAQHAEATKSKNSDKKAILAMCNTIEPYLVQEVGITEFLFYKKNYNKRLIDKFFSLEGELKLSATESESKSSTVEFKPITFELSALILTGQNLANGVVNRVLELWNPDQNKDNTVERVKYRLDVLCHLFQRLLKGSVTYRANNFMYFLTKTKAYKTDLELEFKAHWNTSQQMDEAAAKIYDFIALGCEICKENTNFDLSKEFLLKIFFGKIKEFAAGEIIEAFSKIFEAHHQTLLIYQEKLKQIIVKIKKVSLAEDLSEKDYNDLAYIAFIMNSYVPKLYAYLDLYTNTFRVATPDTTYQKIIENYNQLIDQTAQLSIKTADLQTCLLNAGKELPAIFHADFSSKHITYLRQCQTFYNKIIKPSLVKHTESKAKIKKTSTDSLFAQAIDEYTKFQTLRIETATRTSIDPKVPVKLRILFGCPPLPTNSANQPSNISAVLPVHQVAQSSNSTITISQALDNLSSHFETKVALSVNEMTSPLSTSNRLPKIATPDTGRQPTTGNSKTAQIEGDSKEFGTVISDGTPSTLEENPLLSSSAQEKTSKNKINLNWLKIGGIFICWSIIAAIVLSFLILFIPNFLLLPAVVSLFAFSTLGVVGGLIFGFGALTLLLTLITINIINLINLSTYKAPSENKEIRVRTSPESIRPVLLNTQRLSVLAQEPLLGDLQKDSLPSPKQT